VSDPVEQGAAREARVEKWRERPLAEVRRACTLVAERARQVRIDPAALEHYADAIPRTEVGRAPSLRLPRGADAPEARAAFVVTLDCVNFGSGYWPHLRKRPGLSGYRTIEAALIERFERRGPWSAASLAALEPGDLTRLFEQDPGSDPIAELMRSFADALRELGAFLEREHGGRFLDLLDRAGGSAESLVRELVTLESYRDVASYEGEPVPFLKRAQITASDLALALPERARFLDLHALTLFADNLVPHVLRLDDVLLFEPELIGRIERGEPLGYGSAAEVEIRACAVEAVERLAMRTGLAPRVLDAWLWSRGSGPGYKARPRHRCPNRFY
jgi:hypothetical protein